MQKRTQEGATRGYVPQYTQPQQPQQQWTNYQPMPQQQYQQQPQYPQYPQQYQQPTYQPQQYQQYQQYQQPSYQPQQYQQQYRQPQADLSSFIKKRDMMLMVSAIIAVLWFIIVCSSFASLMNTPQGFTEAEQLGYEIGTTIGLMTQIPFLIVSFIGIVFNCLAWFMSKRGFAITAGVLFSVSVLFSIGNAIGYIACLVLCFIGASRLKKRMA